MTILEPQVLMAGSINTQCDLKVYSDVIFTYCKHKYFTEGVIIRLCIEVSETKKFSINKRLKK